MASGGDPFLSQRRSSKSPPPNMSELRIVLLGKNSSEISRVGNFILDRAVFDTEAPPPSVEQSSERARGKVEGRYITLINTPHLFDPQLTQGQIIEQITESMTLCSPGPHVLVLVLQPDDFTETDRNRLSCILRSLSDEASKHTLVLTTQKLQTGSSVDVDEDEENITQIITEHSNRHFEFSSGCSRSALVEMMEKIVEENEGRHLKWEEYEDASLRAEQMLQQTTAQKESERTVQEKKTKDKEKLCETLNLVLCGSNRALKASISDLILGQRQHSPESSSVCVRREGEVCGRLITLVELPALYDTQLSEEEVMRETLHCVSLCDPGVHAFLLLVPEGNLTDEDKGEMEKIQKNFGSRFNNNTIFLFTPSTQQQAVKLDDAVKNISETYKRPVCVLEARGSSMLLQKVQQMVEENSGSCYTTAMYSEAQIETLLKYKSENEELKNTNSFQKIQKEDEGRGAVRIVLLGKTGVGKSASGNTILGREVFCEELSSVSVTSVCQKESAELRGRCITVIDTPGLFDTNIPNEELRKEITKCVTMAAPGPQVFLLVLSLAQRFTQEDKEAVKMIQDQFGGESKKYTMVLFTRGDELRRTRIETFIQNSDRSLQNLIHQCGNRFHVFNNRNTGNRTQVPDLLDKIDSMVAVNGGSCYTNEMFQQVEAALQEEQQRILKEREEEIEREKEELKAQYEAEIEKMKKQQEDFGKEMGRKDLDHKEQMQRDLEYQREKYEREKEKVRRQKEEKARKQAEEEFWAKLEIEVAKARAEGKKEGKKDTHSKAAGGGAIGGAVGGVIGMVGGPVGAVGGGAVGSAIGSLISRFF